MEKASTALFDFTKSQKKVLKDIIDLVIMRKKSRYLSVAGKERW